MAYPDQDIFVSKESIVRNSVIFTLIATLSVSACASSAERLLNKLTPPLPEGVELKEVTCSNIKLGPFSTDECEEKMRTECPNGHVRRGTKSSATGIGGLGKSTQTVTYYCK